MPKTAIDYSKSIIYKIQHITDKSLLYVGSTTEFTKRKCIHKSDCYNENSKKYNLKIYVMIRANGGWNSFEMIPIQLSPCNNSIELRIQEEKVKNELEANLNSQNAYTSKEQKVEQKVEYNKEYYEKNREKLAEYKVEYYEKNKEQITKYKAEYYENNKEYYEKNKEKYTCDCGSICNKGNKLRHEKSQKHISYLAI